MRINEDYQFHKCKRFPTFFLLYPHAHSHPLMLDFWWETLILISFFITPTPSDLTVLQNAAINPNCHSNPHFPPLLKSACLEPHHKSWSSTPSHRSRNGGDLMLNILLRHRPRRRHRQRLRSPQGRRDGHRGGDRGVHRHGFIAAAEPAPFEAGGGRRREGLGRYGA